MVKVLLHLVNLLSIGVLYTVNRKIYIQNEILNFSKEIFIFGADCVCVPVDTDYVAEIVIPLTYFYSVCIPVPFWNNIRE